jgi:hypothetical protein
VDASADLLIEEDGPGWGSAVSALRAMAAIMDTAPT